MNRRRTTDRTKLSVIFVNFNTDDFLSRSIESVYLSTLPKSNIELFVVDNNSTDPSLRAIVKNYPDVNILRNTTNTGFSRANNQAIARARGDYILLLNPDTIVETNTLTTLLSYMDRHTDVGICTPRVELPDGTLDDACHRGFPTPWNALCFFTGVARLFPHSQWLNGYHLGYRDMDKVHPIDAGCGACLLIRRKAGEQVGWLDEDYFWYGEDIDLCYRVKKSGWSIHFVPTTKIIHYKGVSSGIKAHSQQIATADRATKDRATRARFAVMRTFYRKHYVTKYPRWLTSLVLWGINILEGVYTHQLR